jgi:hypothetical protein
VLRNRSNLTVNAVLVVVAAAGFTAQLIAGRPVLGPLGLVFLGVPGFVISQTVRPVPLSWPEVALVTLATTLITTILVGIVAALSPRGLSATTVAATELVPLALAAVVVARATPHRAVRARIQIRVRPGSVLAVWAGLTLALAGFFVAARAAETQQQQASVMQFWSVASATGGEPVLGLRNATGASLDCSIAVSRPKLPDIDLDVGAVDDGQSWSGSLPARDATDTSRWQISLHCDGADGLAIQRRLFVDPEAS